MASMMQSDLFGDSERQGDLFGEVAAHQRVWTPDPDKVRRRLERILAEARAAERMPWNWAQRSLYKKIFPDMAKLLPESEAEQYRFQFEREWERLLAT